MKNKKLIYGAYSTVLTVVVVIIAIVLNIAIERIETKNALKLDLTKNRMYSLDNLTVSQIKDFDKEIYIYFFVESSVEGIKDVQMLDELLARYAAEGKNIHVEHLDPAKEPGLVQKFSRSDTPFPSPIAIVVAQGDARKNENVKFRPPIASESLMDMDTGAIIAERIITGAIMSFNESETVKVWFAAGHGDVIPENNAYVQNYLEAIGYDVGKINLGSGASDLKPDDVLIIGGLTSDFSKEEADVVEAFIDDGGNLMVMFEYTKSEFPVFDGLMSKYKISADSGVVLERSSDYIFREGYNNIILTDRSSHKIIDTISQNAFIVMTNSRPVEVKDVNTSTGEIAFGQYTGTVSKLITSSVTSYFKPNDADSLAFTQDDKQGPFALGLAYELKNGDKDAKITVFGSTAIFHSSTGELRGNFGTFINSINWMADRGTINIPGKIINSNTFEIKNAKQVTVLSIIVVIVVPVLILGLGLYVWIKRKHR